jgi:hypothetical protein
MSHQSITQATCDSIMLLTFELPAPVLPLARVVLAHTTDKHLPENVKAGLESLFTSNPLDADDEVYEAVGNLMDIAIREDYSPEGRSQAQQAREVLESEGAIFDALAAMRWLREVQALAAADGIAMPLH